MNRLDEWFDELLSAEDQQRVAEALIDPPEPNAALKEAKRQYLETVHSCNMKPGLRYG